MANRERGNHSGRAVGGAMTGNPLYRAVFEGRRPTNPDDQWSPLEPPLTEDQLSKAREASLSLQTEDSPLLFSADGREFTCDGCASRYICPLVFDWYNTGGDCIMEK